MVEIYFRSSFDSCWERNFPALKSHAIVIRTGKEAAGQASLVPFRNARLRRGLARSLGYGCIFQSAYTGLDNEGNIM
jgi:hypothetical protein